MSSKIPFFLLLAIVCGCSDSSRPQANTDLGDNEEYYSEVEIGLRIDGIRRQVTERSWATVVIQRQSVFTNQDDFTLYNPGLIDGDENGNIFVFDYSDFLLKSYNIDSGPISRYGNGRGVGPQEFMSVMGLELLGDTLVVVLDMYGEKLEYFSYSGEYRKIKKLDRPFTRFSISETGQEYYMGLFPDFLIQSEYRGVNHRYPSLDPSTARDRLQFSGFIEAYSNGVLFSPLTNNYVAAYSPDGTFQYAFETVPRGKKHGYSGQDNSRSISIDTDYIYVQARNVEATDSSNTVIDVYDIGNGEYKWSIRIPVRSRLAKVSMPYFYSLQDTSVAIVQIKINDAREAE